MQKIKLLVFLLLLGITLFIDPFFVKISINAQSPLSLSKAVEITLANHPDMIIAHQNLYKTRTALKGAKSEHFPRVDLVFDNKYINTIDKFEPTKISSSDPNWPSYTVTTDMPDYNANLSCIVSKSLFSGGRITNSIKGAKARIKETEGDTKVIQRGVVLSTIKAYWELKRAEKIVAIGKEKIKHSESISEVAIKRFERGTISGLEREKAEVNLVNQRRDLLQAETAQKIAQNKLLLELGIIGKDSPADVLLQDEPEYNILEYNKETIEKTINKALILRPEIELIQARIQHKKAQVKVAQADYYPQVDLVGQYDWIGYSSESLNNSWEDIKEDFWLVGLKVKMNIFEGFATKSKVNEAESLLSISMREFERQKQIITQEIRRAYYDLMGASKRIPLSQKSIAIAEKNLHSAKRQFELGATTINEVAEYNLDLADAKKEYINALIDFEIAKAELKWAAGEELL